MFSDTNNNKRHKRMPQNTSHDFFELLPDDIVLSILGKLSSTANSPSDFISVLITYVSILYFLKEKIFCLFLFE